MTDQRSYRPLADRIRPETLEEYIGQDHILGSHTPLRQAIEQGKLHSMVFWGPPGAGKTTIARIMSNRCEAQFLTLPAVLSGVKEIRLAIEQAQKYRQAHNKDTIFFIDEVHRFNKAQQDAFLPYVENGSVVFVGATTENPSFELNNALLSRVRVYVLRRLGVDAIVEILRRALMDTERGLGDKRLRFEGKTLEKLAFAVDGDARRALNVLEIAADLTSDGVLTEKLLIDILSSDGLRVFDKGGDIFYDQLSALHKSVRGSSPDAALYWFCRMIDGGCDPLVIARRVVRIASEDVGNADPRSLRIALDAWEAIERLGSPEGELAIAQALVYLASAAKSNSVYKAFNQAMQDVHRYGTQEVPLHLRNAPTKLMRDLDYGRNYRYAHDEDNAYVAGENYFPEKLKGRRYYCPVDRGLEIKIKEKLEKLSMFDKQAEKNKLEY